ncbi:MAG: sigma-54 dependent transcriptional regulator [Desulfobacterales bacterium]|nr:sigma-54 dependent transcriptional regulator [Desulfobacterales bacterium]
MYPSVLIVDDEPSILQSLSGILSDEGFETITAANGYEALQRISAESPDLVLLDIWMPGIDGIETLKEIKKDHPWTQVIIITGHGTIDTAVQATKLGAYDFIEKPLSIEKVIVAINNALNFRKLSEEIIYLRKKTIEKHSISGQSDLIKSLKMKIEAAAPTDSWVLIRGENGTGKELVARTIHQLSVRADQTMIDVSCAAIPEEAIESELFGHEKGAFPSASSKKRGKFELANKSTIFFDEIADMSLKTQSKILRTLQEGKFQRVGGQREIIIDVRVIATTNKNMEEEIAEGRFREDLFYRLNVIPIEVPPLRDRIEDLFILVNSFLAETADYNRTKPKQMAPDAIELLKQYQWPGNVRELKNLVERLSIMAEKDTIEALDLPEPYNQFKLKTDSYFNHQLLNIDNLKEARKVFEKEFIKHSLLKNENNIRKTADAIGIDRSSLHKKIKKLGLN